ncbi:MAG: hypothetical protein ACI4WW_04215 [Candidatus Coprovivens sp.]
MYNNLSILKLVDGLSKTIRITKKVLPIYNEIKPYINKSTKLLSNMNFNNQKTLKTDNILITKESNNPVFFQ